MTQIFACLLAEQTEGKVGCLNPNKVFRKGLGTLITASNSTMQDILTVQCHLDVCSCSPPPAQILWQFHRNRFPKAFIICELDQLHLLVFCRSVTCCTARLECTVSWQVVVFWKTLWKNLLSSLPSPPLATALQRERMLRASSKTTGLSLCLPLLAELPQIV